MAGKADIEAGRAYVALFMKDKGFAKGLDAAGAKLKSVGKGISIFGAAVAGVGASITAPMLAMVHSVTEAGSSMKLMSERTGLSAEALSELRYAAEQSGASIEDVQKALLMAAKKGFDPQKFDEMAASLAAIEDPGKRAEAAFKIFGKGAGAILPMLHDLPRLRQEARDLGLVMSDKTATGAHKLHNAWNTLGRVVGGVKGAIGGALIPVIQQYVEWQTKVAISVRDWVRQHKEMFVAAFKVGAVLVAAGTAIAAFGGAVAIAGQAIIGINAVLGVVVGLLGAAVSPVGLLVAGLSGLSFWFMTSTKWGQEFASSLANWFQDLASIAKDAFGGIADALSAGDLKLAGEVALAGLEVAWVDSIGVMQLKWNQFWRDIKEMASRTVIEIAREMELIWNGIKAGPQGFLVIIENLGAMIGNKIGTELTKSADPALAAEQEKARRAANEVIGQEGIDALAAIDDAERKINEFYDKAQDGVQGANKSNSAELAKLNAQLAAAESKLKGLRATAANERKNRELKGAPEFAKGDFDLSPDKIKSQVFGTFSAAAAALAGGGESSTLKEQRKANWIHLQALKAAQDMRAYLKSGLAAKA